MAKLFGGIFLTLLLVFQFTGNHVLFHIQRAKIRHEIKQRIKNSVPENELVYFSFAKKDQPIQWHNDHEFRYEKMMYDVIHLRENHDSIFIACISDQQETHLFAQLDKTVNNTWQHSTNNKQPLLIYQYIYSSANISIHLFSHGQKPNFGYLKFAKSWIPSPHSPPPKNIF